LTSSKDDQITVEGTFLLGRLRNEFTSITIRKWGYFFPCLTATWQFITHVRPGVLGDVTAGYDSEPYFIGRGAEWFVDTLLMAQDYQDLVEPIWYQVAHSITPVIRQREYMRIDEFPELSNNKIEDLSRLILSKVDDGVRQGIIV
jgi:hypothetical protein